jgi:ubiquinone/menaquinone biosynthesis C-methylase UbiE
MKCPICNEKKLYFLFFNEDHESKKKFKIFECKNCSHKFTKFFKNKISHFYTKNYYGINKKKFKSIFEYISVLLRYFRIIKFWNIKNKKILDIGYGRGIELLHFQKKNKTFGIETTNEYFSELKKHGVKTIRSNNLRSAKLKDNYFDLVMMWHNLEHQKHLNLTIKKIYLLLNKNGKIIIEVPNSDSFQAKISNKDWIYLDAPRHFHHFTFKSIKTLLKKNGFKITYYSTFSIEYGPFGMTNSILNIFSKKNNLVYKILLNNKIDNPNFLKYCWIMLIALIVFPFAFTLELFLSFFLAKGSVLKIIAVKNV